MKIEMKDVLKTYKSAYSGMKVLSDYNNLFPISSSEILAGIVGDLFGDGHLQGDPKWRIDFTSASKKELQRFANEFSEQFKVNGKIRPCRTNKFGNTFNYGINCKPIARALFLCGVPAGNKVLQPTKIPIWILQNSDYFKRFVQRLFDCEGSVSVNDKAIEIQMYKNEKLLKNGFKFFYDIKRGFKKHFDIVTSKPFTEKRVNIRKDGIRTKAIRLKIKNSDSLVKFWKYINFETPSKQKNLKEIIDKIYLKRGII